MKKKILQANNKVKKIKSKISKRALRHRILKAQAKEITAPARQKTGLFNLKAPKGAHKHRKILGRGSSSGHGKTSSRGSKGQTSRSGRATYLGFEGGQMPLIRKIAKRGFTNRFKKEYQIINLGNLNKVKETTVTPDLLEQNGLIKDKRRLVKILGAGELKRPIIIYAHAVSNNALEKIKNAGAKVEIIHAGSIS